MDPDRDATHEKASRTRFKSRDASLTLVWTVRQLPSPVHDAVRRQTRFLTRIGKWLLCAQTRSRRCHQDERLRKFSLPERRPAIPTAYSRTQSANSP